MVPDAANQGPTRPLPNAATIGVGPMKIKPFVLERYFAEYEFSAPYLLCCSDCESFSLKELLELEPDAQTQFLSLRLGYTPSPGTSALRRQIATLYHHVHEDHVLVHSGAEEAIFNFMNVVLDPGDHIVVHYPAYQSLFQIAESIGCDVTRWMTREEEGWELDLDFLSKNLKENTKVVVINCPHNPTGYVLSRQDFQSLIDLSHEHDFIIFSDEVYRFLEYKTDVQLPALCDVDERGVSLGVMSKSFGLAGLRIGWIATRNKQLFEKLAAFKDYTTICNSAPSEFLAEIALKHRDTILQRNLDIIRNNLEVLQAFFARHDHVFHWAQPKAGPIAFPSLVSDSDSQRFCHDLVTKTGVLLLPGILYGLEYAGNFRIGYGRRNLAQCIEKLREYLDSNR
jgi:aspartate/methionine/tyrosine aminotransferase